MNGSGTIQMVFSPDEIVDALKPIVEARGYRPVEGIRFTTRVTVEDGLVVQADIENATCVVVPKEAP
jgi:hypothetical protein